MKKIFILGILGLSILFAAKLNAYGYGYVKRGNDVEIGKYEEELKDTNSFYKGSGKRVYLTFDCGYENGYTAKILETLKKNNVTAIFFITGHYLKTSPTLVQQMREDKQIIANHTNHHKHLTKVSDEAAINDITELETMYLTLTGDALAPFYRPPAGEFTREKLLKVKDLGYTTLFWSLAYHDWDKNLEPTKALQILEKGLFDGAIILLHAVSETNALILDDFIKLVKSKGYTFSSPYDFVNEL